MGRTLRARLTHNYTPSELNQLTNIVTRCRGISDPTDRKVFLNNQPEDTARLVKRINGIERTNSEELKKEYIRTFGHNGSRPKEGYFLALINYNRGL